MSARLNYIKQYTSAVINAAKGTGLFPSLFMAQAILESGNGQSTLAKKYNNHFGIKASKNWKGKVIDMNTREVFDGKEVYIKDGFRWYNNPLDSFIDRVSFLKNNPRYTKHGVFTAQSPEAQADALQRAGYATAPNYAQTLKWLIQKYNLKSLDQLMIKKKD
jgi:flagellum-specific peptidoglycan hydrolase FlgJ